MDNNLPKMNDKTCNCDGHENNETSEKDIMLVSKVPRRLTEVYESLPLTEEITCGVGCCKGSFLQRFANTNVYLYVYSISGAVHGAIFAYFNGTVSTMEKRFQIPSKTIGIITIGNNISGTCLTLFLTYYASRGHIPRWIAGGLYTVVAFCILNTLPHLLYGPGDSAFKLTLEYADSNSQKNQSFLSFDETGLCQDHRSSSCDKMSGSLAPVIILFISQLVAGFGDALYYTLGVAYLDNNVKKDRSPALISVSYFIRMLGPAFGYGLSSYCLKMYISPNLTPTITQEDPRWLGAWWLGWLVLGTLLFTMSSILLLFPKTMPLTVARKVLEAETKKLVNGRKASLNNEDMPASFQDLIVTLKRLVSNKILMLNTFSMFFFFFAYSPYWNFIVKYMEIIFKKSASEASFMTGNVGIVFTALGLLSSGFVISKLKPCARNLAAWNIFVSVTISSIVFSFIFIGCPINESQMDELVNGNFQLNTSCNKDCDCEEVPFTPVCATNEQTFISPCHAGCHNTEHINGTKAYTDCSCVDYQNLTQANYTYLDDQSGYVLDGPCPLDCSGSFMIFIILFSCMKFFGATGRLSNFLIAVRCVEERDKAVSMGVGGTLLSLFAFIPAPILFGYILDQACIVWGKTCSGTGNCWLYDPKAMRHLLNGTAFFFFTCGVLFEIGIWYYAKDLKVFDDEDKQKNPKKKDKFSQENAVL